MGQLEGQQQDAGSYWCFAEPISIEA